MCHITAKEEGGPRYDPSLSPAQRNGFENLLLLCGEHHDIIDGDKQTYTVPLLREMKAEHKRAAQKEIRLNDEIIDLFVRLFSSFRQPGNSGRAEYQFVRGKWSAWLGTAANRLRFASIAQAAAALGAVTYLGTCGYTTQRFGWWGAPEWAANVEMASVFVGLVGLYSSVSARAWQSGTYQRVFRRDFIVDDDGSVCRVGVSGVCGKCRGELRLRDAPTHPSESVVGICRNNSQHVFTFDATTLTGEQTILPKPAPA